MPMVIKARSIKEESLSLLDIKDLEDLVINTMGEDVWNAIMYFTEEKIEETKESSDYSKEQIRDYDNSLYALRAGVRDEFNTIEKLGNYVNDISRLNRATIIEELKGIKRRLEDNEGYL
jgi:hypothetical protein